MINDLGHSPYEPGDTIRDKKTGIDYVVHSAVSLAAVGGTIIYALSLYGAKLREFKLNEVDSLDLIIKRKGLGEDAEEIIRRVAERESSLFRSDQDLLTKLAAPEGAIYRDLLQLGEDVDPVAFRQSMVDIAEILSLSGKEVRHGEILSILREMAPPNRYNDEYIGVLADNIVAHSRINVSTKLTSGTWRGTGIATKKELRELILGVAGTPKLSNLSLFREYAFSSVPKTTKLRGSRQYFVENYIKTADDLVRLGEASIEARGGRVGDLSRKILERQAALSYARLKKGESDQLIKMIIDSDPDQIVSRANTEFSRLWNNTSAPWLDYVRTRWRKKKAPRLAKPDINIDRVLGDPLMASDIVPLENGRVGSRILSIGKPTLVNDILKTTDRNIASLIEKEFGHNVYTTPVILRNLVNQVQSGNFTSETIQALKETHNTIRDRLEESTLARTEALHQGDNIFPAEQVLSLTVDGEINRPTLPSLSEIWDALPEQENTLERLNKFFNLPKVGENNSRFYIMRSMGKNIGSTDIDELMSAWKKLGNTEVRLGDLAFADLSKEELSKLPKVVPNVARDILERANPWVAAAFKMQRLKASQDGFAIINRIKELIESNALYTEKLKATSSVMGEHIKHLDLNASSERLAVVQLTKAGETRHLVFGTELNRALEDQIALALKFKNGEGTGALFDIETSNVTTKTGTTRIIRELALGTTQGDMLYRKIGNPEQEASALKELAARLEKGIDFIGTQSNYDFPAIAGRARRLARDLGDQSLEDVANIFDRAAQSKLFNVEVLAQLAGHPLGQTSQERLSQIYGVREKQVHGAKQDVEDLFEIVNKLDVEGVDYKFLRGKELVNKGMTLFNEATTSEGYGSIRQILGLRTGFENGYSYAEALMQNMAFDETGGLVGRGLVTIRRDNVFALGAEMNINSTLVNQTNIRDIHARYAAITDDSALRKVRALDPLARDILEAWDWQNGPYSAHTLQGDLRASALIPEVRARLGHLMAPNDLSALHGRRHLVEKAVSEVLEPQNILDKNLKNYVRNTLISSMEDPRAEKMLLDSAYSRVINSEFGKGLIHMMEEDPSGAHMSVFWAEAMRRSKDTPGALNKFISEPRISFSAIEDRSFKDIGDLATDVVMRIGHRGRESREGAIKILHEAGLSAEEISRVRKLSHRFDAYKNLLEGDRRDYFDTLRNMEHIALEGPESEFYELNLLRQRLLHSKPIKDAVLRSVQKKHENFIAYSEYGSAIERQEFGNSLISILSGYLDEGRSAKEAYELATGEIRKASPKGEETLNEFLKDIYPDWLDYEGYTRNLSSEDIKSIVSYSRNKIDFILEHGGQEALNDILRAAGLSSRGKEGIDSVVSAGETIREATNNIENLHRIVLEARKTASKASNSSVSSVEAMATAMNTARQAVVGESIVQETHEAVLKAAGKRMANRAIEGVTAPLLIAGGLIGLMAASSPKERYSSGRASDKSSWFGGDVAKYAEIPGSPTAHAIWTGTADPFRLDISFKGFVENDHRKNQFLSKVYNVLNGQLEVRRLDSKVRDQRNQYHKQAAREAMRL